LLNTVYNGRRCFVFLPRDANVKHGSCYDTAGLSAVVAMEKFILHAWLRGYGYLWLYPSIYLCVNIRFGPYYGYIY